jgi:hypothetical protein
METVGPSGRVVPDREVQRLDTPEEWLVMEWEEETPEVCNTEVK